MTPLALEDLVKGLTRCSMLLLLRLPAAARLMGLQRRRRQWML